MPMDVVQAETIQPSILDWIPGGIGDFLANLNAHMSNTLTSFLPDNLFTHAFISNPLLILLAFFLVTASIAMFFDFIADAYKMPFAIFIDILDLMAIAVPGVLDFVAGGGALVVFFILATEPNWARYTFGAIGAVKCLIPIPIIQLLPINTVLMFIATIID